MIDECGGLQVWGRGPEFPPDRVGPEARRFILACLTPDPARRPDVAAALADPWLRPARASAAASAAAAAATAAAG